MKKRTMTICGCVLMSAALVLTACSSLGDTAADTQEEAVEAEAEEIEAEEEEAAEFEEEAAGFEEGPMGGDTMSDAELMDMIVGDHEYEEFDVECERDGLTLVGTLTLPILDDDELAPVVIMSHGFSSDRSEMEKLAKGFAVNGIASVRFDFAGSGESDGDSTDMSVLTEEDDLNAILDYVMTLEEVDTDGIFLLGDSMGGLVTALVAAEREDDITALLLNFLAFSIPDNMRDGQLMFLQFDPNDVPEILDLGDYAVGSRYVTDVLDMDPFELACGFSKDVLLMHGDSDIVVDISYAEKAAEMYPSAEFIVVEGAGHGFMGEQVLDQIERSVAFVKEEMEKK